MPADNGGRVEADRAVDVTETANDPRIPAGQTYFKIGEVARIVGVKPYVLRYWENEFSWVKPEKTTTNQRRYRRQDVAVLLQIKRLRYDEQLPVKRARELIRESRRRGSPVRRPTARLIGAARGPTDERFHRDLDEMRTILQGLLEAVED